MVIDVIKRVELLAVAREAITTASEVILDIYQQDDFAIETKKDHTPVTRADKESSAIIEKILLQKTNTIVISEENTTNVKQNDLYNKNFWLIDPIDGTKHFISKDGEFSVNLALISQGEILAGYVYAPVSKTFYHAVKGLGAYKISNFNQQNEQEIRIKSNGLAFQRTHKLKILTGKRSGNNKQTIALIDHLKKDYRIEEKSLGSSLKMCQIAEGKSDLYPRIGGTSEWDTAAAHIILKEAGGNIITLPDLKELSVLQNNKDWGNPHFIACGTPDIQWMSDGNYLPEITSRFEK